MIRIIMIRLIANGDPSNRKTSGKNSSIVGGSNAVPLDVASSREVGSAVSAVSVDS
jgi:hypothetical protein